MERIQIYFRVVYIECKQEISPGKAALWSREEKCIKHLRCEQNDAAAPGMNIVSLNKTCFVCEMQSPTNIVINDLDLDFAVAAMDKSDTCICATCLAELNAHDYMQTKVSFKASKSSKEKEY
jgi:hypothetical protein